MASWEKIIITMIIFSLNLCTFLMIQCQAKVAVTRHVIRANNRVILKNAKLTLELDLQSPHNIIKSIIDNKTTRNFVQKNSSGINLYKITLVSKKKKRIITDSAQAVSVVIKKIKRDSIKLSFKHKNPAIEVEVYIKLAMDKALSYWQLNVVNNTQHAIISVDFPGFSMAQVLGTNPHDTKLIFPEPRSTDLYWNMPAEFNYYKGKPHSEAWNVNGKIKKVNRKVWPYTLINGFYPDMLQMIAYYDSQSGLFLSTFDSQNYIKEFSIIGLNKDNLRIKVDHLRAWHFGENFIMKYNTVIGIFHGDWTAAADLYKTWAIEQPWCRKGKVKYRKDLPAWVKNDPGFSSFRIDNSPYFTKKNKAWFVRIKWKALAQVIDNYKYQELIKNSIIHLIHFDKGYWQALYKTDRWDTFIPQKQFIKFIKNLKKKGCHPRAEPFCHHIPPKPKYLHLWEQSAVHHENIKNHHRQEKKGVINICVGSNYGRNVLEYDAVTTAPWGMDSLQMMDTQLAFRMDCFNPNHQHPLGRGKWVYDEVIKSFDKARIEGRKLNPEMVFDKEDLSELLIPCNDIAFSRFAHRTALRYKRGHSSYKNTIPLFDYLYHEYIIFLSPIMANDAIEARYFCANAVALGHIAGAHLEGNPAGIAYKFFDKKIAGKNSFELLIQGQKIKRGYAKEYLIFGKVLPKPQLKTPTYKTFPAIITSAHIAEDMSLGFCFINISETTININFNIMQYKKQLKKSKVHLQLMSNNNQLFAKDINIAQNPIVSFKAEPMKIIFLMTK